MGHNIRIRKGPGGIGDVHGVMIEYEDGRPVRFFGGAEHCGFGTAEGD